MSQSLIKALRIVTCLGASGAEGLGVRELARQIGLNPSTVHGLLKTLGEQGFVAHDEETRRYQLGLAVASLAQAVDPGACLRIMVMPEIERLFAILGESVTAVAWLDGRAVVLGKHQSDHQLVVALPDGVVAQPHLWASGLVLLAHRDPTVVTAYMAEQTRRSPQFAGVDLPLQLAQVRRVGHAEAINVNDSGIAALGVPVADAHGEVRLALAVSAPLARLPAAQRAVALTELQRSADVIAAQLRTAP